MVFGQFMFSCVVDPLLGVDGAMSKLAVVTYFTAEPVSSVFRVEVTVQNYVCVFHSRNFTTLIQICT